MNRAFTLIEMVAATALAVVLLAALLAVAASTARSDAAIAQADAAAPTSTSTRRAIDLIRWDLAHARAVESAADGFRIVGYACLDRATLTPTHRPADVTYRLVAGPAGAGVGAGADAGGGVGPGRWLVRQQTDLIDPTNRATWTDIVLAGVDAVELTPLRDDGGGGQVGGGDSADPDAPPGNVDRGALPDRWRLTLRLGAAPGRTSQTVETVETILVMR